MNEIEVQNHSAEYYDTRYSKYGLKYHRDLTIQLMGEARTDQKILDVGCGTGFVSRLFPQHDIVGIDLSERMLARHPGLHYWMDVCRMDFAEATFDFLLCRSLLHHLPDHRAGLREMRRVLKPGGKAVFLETNKSVLATWIRARTQHGDRFSAYHHAFRDTDLLNDIRKEFVLDHVQYVGYVAYPLFGFPDIIDFARWIPWKVVVYPFTMVMDECLSWIPGLRRLSWALLVKAHKL